MTPDILRMRDEQIQAATLLLAGHPDERGLRQGITDAFAEEMILLHPEMWR